MREILRASIVVALLASAAACSSTPEGPAGPRTLPAGERPMSGEAPPDRTEIRATLLGLCDRVLGELSDATGPFLDDPGVDPQVRIKAMRTKIRIGTTVLALATGPSVESAVVDLYCYLAVTEARLRSAEDGTSVEDEAMRRLGRAIAGQDGQATGRGPAGQASGAVGQARRLLERTATSGQVAAIDAAVTAFLREDSSPEAGFLLRLDDFAALRGMTERIVGPGSDLLSTVERTRSEIQVARESAELMDFAVQRLPTLARWQLRLLIEEVLNGPSLGRALGVVDRLSSQVDALARRVDAAATIAARIDTRVEETIKALGQAEGPLAINLADARATIAEAKALGESLEGTLPALDATLGSAREALEAMRTSVTGIEELRARLKEDGVTLDPAAAAETARQLASASADLKAALGEAKAVLASDDASARLGEIVSASRTATDYLFWRAGLLLLIATCLAIVLRVAWVLTGRRGKA